MVYFTIKGNVLYAVVSYFATGLVFHVFDKMASIMYQPTGPPLILIVLWPVRAVNHWLSWRERYTSSERFYAGDQYFASYSEALAVAKREANESGTPSLVQDNAGCTRSRYSPGGWTFKQISVDPDEER